MAPYATAYDVESNQARPGRLAKRVIHKNRKALIGISTLLILVFFFTDLGGGPRHPQGVEGEWDEDWDDRPPEGPPWKFGKFGNPFQKGGGGGGGKKVVKPPRPGGVTADGHDYIVDSGGNHFLLNWKQNNIPPLHPDISVLPKPSSFFTEIDLSEPIPPPTYHPFPDSKLDEILSSSPTADQMAQVTSEPPPDAYYYTWKPPKVWDEPRGKVNPVQWSGFTDGVSEWETSAQKKVREERRDAVKRGFLWAWQGYKKFAWGNDEVKPFSQTASDPFNNWGASIVDTLDTLLLLGLEDEYNLCRPHVNQINFNWVNGRDWSQAFQSKADPSDPEAVSFSIPRDPRIGLPVFETGIRYLGGLLGAYDLSGDSLLIERAVDIATILGRAFYTESGLPAGRIDPGITANWHRLGQVSLAEVGSMTLELIRLSQITGDRKWYDMAQRATDFLDEKIAPKSVFEPLIPMWFMPSASNSEAKISGGFTFGGLADSYYEYLIKTYKLLGASQGAQQYRKLYEGSIEQAKKLLYTDVKVVPGVDLFTIGKFEGNRLIPEAEHLTCFAGAMLGLGAKLLDREDDMKTALKFTETCYWLSAATPTGLQPENVEFFTGAEQSWLNVTKEGAIYHPPHDSLPIGSNGEVEHPLGVMHQDREGVWRWNDDQTVVKEGDELDDADQEPVEYAEMLRGVPPGSRRVNGRGINRPETIESIFYMYRLTGDRKWQEKGWKMFTSWMTAAKVDGGISSINDVTAEDVRYGDNMESFMFAETFKYHFLLQSEPDLMSLDDYVLNTEAHPLLTNPSKSPKTSKFWTPPTTPPNLGVRSQGTDSQKWQRHGILDEARKRAMSAAQGGGGGGYGGKGQGGVAGAPARGGGGMGGGGGKPWERPQLPAGFL